MLLLHPFNEWHKMGKKVGTTTDQVMANEFVYFKYDFAYKKFTYCFFNKLVNLAFRSNQSADIGSIQLQFWQVKKCSINPNKKSKLEFMNYVVYNTLCMFFFFFFVPFLFL